MKRHKTTILVNPNDRRKFYVLELIQNENNRLFLFVLKTSVNPDKFRKVKYLEGPGYELPSMFKSYMDLVSSLLASSFEEIKIQEEIEAFKETYPNIGTSMEHTETYAESYREPAALRDIQEIGLPQYRKLKI